MAKKTNKLQKEVEAFNRKVEGLMGKGYAAISPNVALPIGGYSNVATFNSGANRTEYLSSRPESVGGGRMQGKFAFFDGKQSNPKPTPAGVGRRISVISRGDRRTICRIRFSNTPMRFLIRRPLSSTLPTLQSDLALNSCIHGRDM